jgi:hypothetical protein
MVAAVMAVACGAEAPVPEFSVVFLVERPARRSLRPKTKEGTFFLQKEERRSSFSSIISNVNNAVPTEGLETSISL